jgi:hypothetical protein
MKISISNPVRALAPRKSTKSLSLAVVEFIQSLDKLADATISVAEHWGKLTINEKEQAYKAVGESSKRLLKRIERVSQGVLHPQLVSIDTPGQRSLSGLPIDVQSKVLKDGVPLWNPLDDKVKNVPVQELSGEQITQAFINKQGLRPIPEQKIFYKAERAKTQNLKKTHGYHVRGSGTAWGKRIMIDEDIIIKNGLSVKLLKRMLTDVSGKTVTLS